MEIIKKDIRSILLTIASFDTGTGKEISGLLTENLSLAAKRKLQKIRKELLSLEQELHKHASEIEKIFEGKTSEEDLKKRQEELNTLLDETVNINCDYALLSEIEKISSVHNYDFDFIEMIAQ